MLDPQVQTFLDAIAALKRPPIETIPLAEIRALFEESFTRLAGAPVDVANVEDIAAPGPRGPIPIRIFTPVASSVPLPLFVYVHGGGWVCGSPNSYDAVCRLLARESRCVVASVDYRLAPEHPAPAPFEDAYAAFEWLAAHAVDVGATADRLVVGGDSAGGGLAAAVTLKARDAGGPAIAHQLLVYPAVDEDMSSHSYRTYGEGYFLTAERIAFYWERYVPRPELEHDPYLLAARADSLRGLPPATIILAECDPLHDQGVAYANRLRADDVPVDLRDYDGMIHAFFSFIGAFDRGHDAVVDAGRAVRAATETPVKT